MKKVLFSLLMLINIMCFSQPSKGFQYVYTPNVSQYSQAGFYINGPLMIFGGNTSISQGVVMTTDTSGNLSKAWSLSESNGFNVYKIKKIDANNSVITGIDFTFPNSPFIATFNHNTGVVGTGYYYNHSSIGFGSGGAGGSGNSYSTDGISLSNGDLAFTGSMGENLSSTSGPNGLGICGGANGGVGYLAQNFGSSAYGRGDDIFLIRTGSNGDSASGVGNDGFVKKYSIAYAGGGWTPPQPTPINRSTGNFCYQSFPSWMADSTRNDEPTALIEDANHNIFIVGWTLDYCQATNCNSCCSNAHPYTTWTPYDYEGFVLKVNSAGVVQWCKTFYIGAQTGAIEYITGISLVTSDGTNDPIVIMRSQQSNNTEVFRVSNTTGNIVWAKSYSFGVQTYPWSIKKTTNNTFIVGVEYASAVIGSYEMAILELDANGNIVSSKGFGTVNMDGTTSSFWIGPDVDQFSTGTYAISGTTNFSGGTTGGSYMVKLNRQSNTSGCTPNQFTVSATITNRNSGGGNQLITRTPVIYEVRGGGTKGALSMSSSNIFPTSTPTKICVLPIELISFTGEKNGNDVQLKWSTATETNNDYFTIEKSDDGISFYVLTTVKGAGTSSTLLNYTCVDHNPNEKITYYRLKQTDFDGAYTYSNVIAVDNQIDKSFSVLYDTGSNNFVLSFNSLVPDHYIITVYNSIGQQVRKDDLGEVFGAYSKYYDLSIYGSGPYYMSLIGTTSTITKILIRH